MVNIITNDDLSAVKESAAAVVDFSATWCGPCKMLAPVIDELSEEIEGVDFFNVDVDENPELAQEFRIQGVPTVVFMKNGEVVDKSVGYTPKAGMAAFIEKNI